MLEQWGYAKDQDQGIMVGFIQNMDFEDILLEVNQHAAQFQPTLPMLILSTEGWQEQGVNNLTQILSRNFEVSPFPLKHFWVDLRNIYSVVSSQ